MGNSLYQQVYDNLRSRIESGDIALNEKLPSQEELIKEFQVSAITTRRALDMLRNDGFIIRRPKIGSIVVSATATATAATGSAVADESRLPIVGCVMADFNDAFGHDIIVGIMNASRGKANVVFKKSLGNQDHEDQVFADLTSAGAIGIMMLPNASRVMSDVVLRLTTDRFPIVVLDRSYDSVPVSTVSSDTFKASFDAANYLFDLGHQQLGLVEPSPELSVTKGRYNGFVSAHAQRDQAFDAARAMCGIDSVALRDGSQVQDDIRRLVDFLAAHPDLTAVVAYRYSAAKLVAEAARLLGRSVPEDLSIICFDHPSIAFDPHGFHFTHIQQDQALMGEMALAQVLRQAADTSKIEKHVLPTTLVVGDSTAAPRG